MTSPLVTVVTAVFNGEAHLREAVGSIRAQTFHDFEYLVIDDASTDGTAAVLNELATADSRLRVLHNETNLGRAASRNRGLDEARGEFIAILDADDVALPQRLEKEVTFLRNHTDVGVVGTWFEVIDENGERIVTRELPTDPPEIAAGDLEMMPFCHPSVMFRKACVEKIGGYRTEFVFAQDYDLILRMLEQYPGANIPQVLTRYRLSATSCSLRNSVVQRRLAALARRFARERRESGRDAIQREDRAAVDALFKTATSVSWLAARAGIAETCLSWATRLLCAGDTRRARRFMFHAVGSNLLVAFSHCGILLRVCLPASLKRLWRRKGKRCET